MCKGTRPANLDFFNDLKDHMWAKNEGILGPLQSAGDARECVCLNRIFRWSPDNASELKADPRHVQIILSQLGLEATSTKSVVSPAVKAVNADLGELLEGEDATLFRGLTMRCSYLAEDRPDLRFATLPARSTQVGPTFRATNSSFPHHGVQ